MQKQVGSLHAAQVIVAGAIADSQTGWPRSEVGKTPAGANGCVSKTVDRTGQSGNLTGWLGCCNGDGGRPVSFPLGSGQVDRACRRHSSCLTTIRE